MLPGLIDPATGIISRVAHGTADGTPDGLPICAVAALRRSGLSEVGFGKGLDPTEAVISAIGEALELYAASHYQLDDLRHEALNRLAGDRLDPRRLSLYEEALYRESDFPFARFDPRLPIHWTRGLWLGTNQPVWMPALPTFRNFPAPPHERFCQVTSNGLASGSNLVDAAFRATLELLERDAFMLTWYCRLPGRELMVEGALEPGLKSIHRQIERKGASIKFYLLDAGIGVPTVLCTARGDGQNWPGMALGLGTHLNLRIALRKAILELGQTGPHFCALMQSGKEPVPSCPQEVKTFRQHALYYFPAERNRAFDFLGGAETPLQMSSVAETHDFSMSRLLGLLNAARIRIAIADVTTPDLNTTPFRVARALGTDIQEIHCGFRRERTNNPRLKALLKGSPNSAIHPLC
ncbi:MAG TPA: YcaO-like family protein [Candidatus Angelobacter sp.]|nr:YcaO-like family protein [Candidatus Angelobacter sp.]